MRTSGHDLRDCQIVNKWVGVPVSCFLNILQRENLKLGNVSEKYHLYTSWIDTDMEE